MHPTIIIIFILGGCTGIWQPLDIGIQCVMKLSMHWSAHSNIVGKVSAQIAKGETDITVDMTLGTLQNRSVGWVVNSICDVGKKDLITKVRTYQTPKCTLIPDNIFPHQAFELCWVGEFNASHAGLTSPEAHAILWQLPKTNPVLHHELSGIDEPFDTEIPELVGEEPIFQEEQIEDSSNVPIDTLAEHLESSLSTVSKGFVLAEDGSIERNTVVEDADAEVEAIGVGELNTAAPELGHGRHTKKVTVPFGGAQSWERNWSLAQILM
jgi:hypothetical protein